MSKAATAIVKISKQEVDSIIRSIRFNMGVLALLLGNDLDGMIPCLENVLFEADSQLGYSLETLEDLKEVAE